MCELIYGNKDLLPTIADGIALGIQELDENETATRVTITMPGVPRVETIMPLRRAGYTQARRLPTAYG